MRIARGGLGVVLSASVAAAIALIGSSAPAYANEDTQPSASQVVELRESLTALDIDAVTQDKLVYKFFVLRQRLDGDTDAAPVAEKAWTDAKGAHTRYTYADGSKSETVIEQPSSKAGAGRGVAAASGPSASGCDHTRNQDVNNFSGCKVAMSRPTYNMSFIMNYNYQQFGCGISLITSIATGGLGIDPSTKYIGLPKQYSQEHAGVCHATVTVIQTIGVGPASFKSTVGIDVKVQSSSSWTNKLLLGRIDE